MTVGHQNETDRDDGRNNMNKKQRHNASTARGVFWFETARGGAPIIPRFTKHVNPLPVAVIGGPWRRCPGTGCVAGYGGDATPIVIPAIYAMVWGRDDGKNSETQIKNKQLPLYLSHASGRGPRPPGQLPALRDGAGAADARAGGARQR